jgi:hypothetical protein
MARSKFRTIKSHPGFPRTGRRAGGARYSGARRLGPGGGGGLPAVIGAGGRPANRLPVVAGAGRRGRYAAAGIVVAGGAVAVGAGARAVYKRRQRRNRQRRDTRGKFR